MSFPFRPMSDVVVFTRCDHERSTDAGIFIPDVVEKPEQGEVVAVGPGKMIDADTREPMRIKVGDRILINKNMVQRIRYGGSEYETCRQEHVMAVL